MTLFATCLAVPVCGGGAEMHEESTTWCCSRTSMHATVQSHMKELVPSPAVATCSFRGSQLKSHHQRMTPTMLATVMDTNNNQFSIPLAAYSPVDMHVETEVQRPHQQVINASDCMCMRRRSRGEALVPPGCRAWPRCPCRKRAAPCWHCSRPPAPCTCMPAPAATKAAACSTYVAAGHQLTSNRSFPCV